MPRADHRLPRRKPLFDDNVIPLPLPRRDVALRRRAVRVQDENERSLLPDLHRLGRNQQCVMNRRQNQAHLHELPRPKPPILVLQQRPQVNRPRPVLNAVVEKLEFAFRRRAIIVLSMHLNLQCPPGHFRADAIQL